MRWVVVVALPLLLCGAATAESVDEERLEVWTPTVGPRPFPAGPLEVHVVRWHGARLVPVGELVATTDLGSVVVAEGGDPYVRRVVLVPPPRASGTVTLRVQAAALEAVAPIELDDRVMGTVTVSADPPVWVKGKSEGAVALTIETRASNGTLAGDVAPRMFTNTGTVSGVRHDGPGRFYATYTPSTAPFPEVAVVVALLPWPHEASATVAVGQVTVPQPAAIELPGQTEPRVNMVVRIGDDLFGPVRADDNGLFRVPIVVPPGVGEAVGVTKNRFGNAREKPIDLQLPPTQRLALAAHPRELVADGASHALIVLTALDATGAPAAGVRPTLRAEHGSVSEPIETDTGVFHAWYVAPLDVGDGHDVITTGLPRDAKSHAELPITLRPGPPVALDVVADRRVTDAPEVEPVHITTGFRDARGHPVTDVTLHATATYGLVEREGDALSYYPPGSARPGVDRVSLRGFAASDRPAVRLALSPPTTLVAIDAVGRPVPGAAVVAGDNTTYADDEGRVTLPAATGVIQVQLPGAALPTLLRLALGDDGELHGAPSAPPTLAHQLDITLLTPHPVRVEAEILRRESARAEVRWRVNGASGPVALLVDGELRASEAANEGVRWVDAAPAAVIAVAHAASGSVAVLLPRANKPSASVVSHHVGPTLASR